MTRHFALLILLASLPLQLRANYGFEGVFSPGPELALDQPELKVAQGFQATEDMLVRSVAVHVASVLHAPSYSMSLCEDARGKPGKVLARSGGVVPLAGAWMQASLEGAALRKNQDYFLVIEADTMRGGKHPVDRPTAAKFARLSSQAEEVTTSGSRLWVSSGKGWQAQKGSLVWAMLGQGRVIQGLGWKEALALPVHGNGSAKADDDAWQSQVYHFPNGFSPVELKARVRRVGSPKAPLQWVLLKHDYMKHQTQPLAEGQLATAESLGKAWTWVRAKLPPGQNLAPECYYLALKSAAGVAEGGTCRDCYEISGNRVHEGLEMAHELSHQGGAHRDRASRGENGAHWQDDFAADLHLVLLGPPVFKQDDKPAPPPVLRAPGLFLPAGP